MPILIEQVNSAELVEIINFAIEKKLGPVNSLLDTAMSIVVSRKVAAEILNVTPATINNYVAWRMLKPIMKEGSSHMSYLLSDLLIFKDKRKSIPNLKKS